ncbi:hypothetical protein F5X96DRAFT_667741 [Biscogniauxia mediterranea]|nr:hypothetical protein F5X96DRAFT_667741 [Biscogniauxia mediterranea]
MGTPSKTTDKKPVRQPSPSPNTRNTNTHTTTPSAHQHPPTPPPRPRSQTGERIPINSSNNNNNNNNNTTTDPTYQRPGPGFEHQVTNLPGGICYDTRSSLQPPQTYPASAPGPAFPTQASHPSIPCSTYHYPIVYTIPTQLPAMASVNSGVMPNGQAQHFQPQVPDTTNGPYQHTYYPRHDVQGSPVVMINGTPMVQVVGGHVPIQQVATIPQPQPLAGIQAVQYVMPQPALLQGVAPSQVVYYAAQGGIATAPIPLMVQGQQPPPVYIQGQAMPCIGQPAQTMAQPGMVPAMAYPQAGGSGPPGMIPGNGAPGAPPFPPEIMGIGKTGTEFQAEQALAAQSNQVLEPQDMKPSDDDPSRMYYCREIDGTWIQRNRYSIDRMGEFRWFVWPNGVFYAVRLDN